MKTRVELMKKLSLLTVLLLGAAISQAQQVIAPPTYEAVDSNGVNLLTGKFILPGLNVAIGARGSGLTRVVNENSDNFAGKIEFGYIARTADGMLGPGQLTMDASLGGQVYRFWVGGGWSYASSTMNPGPYTQINGVAKLECTGDYTQKYAGGTCTVTLRDGAVAFYSSGNNWLAETLTLPDGEVQSFTYQTGVLRSVSSSLGWMLKYEMDSSNRLTKVTGINTATTYCDPAAVSCSVSGSFPSMTATISGATTTIARNGTDVLSYTVNGNVTTLTRPSGHTTTINYSSVGVSSITTGGSTWTYTYPQGGLTRVTNPDGTTVEVARGPVGVDWEKDELGATRSRSYDGLGNLTSMGEFGSSTPTTAYGRDARGNITSSTVTPSGGGTPLVMSAIYASNCTNFKICNKPTSVTTADGVTISYAYDPNHGGVLSETWPAVNGAQAQTRYGYSQFTPYVMNSSGVLIAQPPVWRVTSISKCMTGHLAACVDTADEVRVTHGYTANNIILYTTTTMRGDGSLPQTTTLDVSSNGLTTAVDGPRSGTVDKSFTFYDNLGRKVGEIGPDPDGGGSRPRLAVRTTYDADGRVSAVEKGTTYGTTATDLASMSVKNSDTTEFSPTTGLPAVDRHYEGSTLTSLSQTSYDNRFRVSCVAQRLNSSVYSSITATSACTVGPVGPDGKDRVTKFDYNGIGAVTTVTEAYGTTIARVENSKTYNNNRTVATAVDGKGNKSSYTYDNFARLTKTCFPHPSTGSVTNTSDCKETVYNPNGTVASQILRDGQAIYFGYDAAGRISSKSGAVSEVAGYNNFDQLVSHTNNSVSETLSYNSLGWLLSHSQPAGTLSYGYDATGRRNLLTYPGGFSVTYGYDDLNALTGLTPSSGAGSISIDYDNYGRRAHIYRGNGQTTTYGFDSQARLQTLAHGSANTSTLDYTQSRQINSKTNSNSAFTHPLGNAGPVNYTIDGLNRISGIGSVNIGYDGRGNLSGDSQGTYLYNAHNLLTSTTQVGATSTLTYDAENRLLSLTKFGTTTRFLYDGDSLIAEYDGSGNLLRRYIHGSRVNEPLVWLEGTGTSDPRFFHANEAGSIVSVTDVAGTTRSINTYDAYGSRLASNVTYAGRFGFTGQAYLPEIGLYYYKARMYSASFGRFLQTDPIGYGDGMNWYAYAQNDPINRIDPSGMDNASVASFPMNTGSLLFGLSMSASISAGKDKMAEWQRFSIIGSFLAEQERANIYQMTLAATPPITVDIKLVANPTWGYYPALFAIRGIHSSDAAFKHIVQRHASDAAFPQKPKNSLFDPRVLSSKTSKKDFDAKLERLFNTGAVAFAGPSQKPGGLLIQILDVTDIGVGRDSAPTPMWSVVLMPVGGGIFELVTAYPTEL